MTFESYEYIFFFSLIFVTYYVFPNKLKEYFLITSSFVFCSFAGLESCIALFSAIIFFYFSSLLIIKSSGRNKKLLTSLSIILIVLIFISYRIFLQSTYNIVTLLGFSYFLFSGISYILETSRENIPQNISFFKFSLFLSFFPKLSAGPIERINNFNNNNTDYKFNYTSVSNGLKLIAWGFFKKLVISNRLEVVSDSIFNNPHSYSGLSIAIGVLFYSIQIYADFSGYTDIALGSAQMLGYKLTNNFQRPYFAKSISDFWTRWHITLSFWVRDYVFLPTAYLISRYKIISIHLKIRIETISYIIAVLSTMLLIGIWHGFGLTFIIWGFIHAFYMITSRLTKYFRKSILKKINLYNGQLHNFFKVIITFSLVTIAWIFFRSENLNDAIYIIKNIILNTNIFSIKDAIANTGLNSVEFFVALFSIVFLFSIEYFQSRIGSIRDWLSEKNTIIRWTCYASLVFGIILFGSHTNDKFIYLKF